MVSGVVFEWMIAPLVVGVGWGGVCFPLWMVVMMISVDKSSESAPLSRRRRHAQLICPGVPTHPGKRIIRLLPSRWKTPKYCPSCCRWEQLRNTVLFRYRMSPMSSIHATYDFSADVIFAPAANRMGARLSHGLGRAPSSWKQAADIASKLLSVEDRRCSIVLKLLSFEVTAGKLSIHWIRPADTLQWRLVETSGHVLQLRWVMSPTRGGKVHLFPFSRKVCPITYLLLLSEVSCSKC